MSADLLEHATWTCRVTAADEIASPSELATAEVRSWPTSVPGTAAGALRAAGEPGWRERDYDNDDWWFTTRFHLESKDCRYRLVLDGLATIAEVFVNETLVHRSENMFLPAKIELGDLQEENEIAICCRSLAKRCAARHPRAHWRARIVERQNLRWYRTTLLGRIPSWAGSCAPVGPWRTVELQRVRGFDLLERRVVARCLGDDGIVEARLLLGPGDGALEGAELLVGEEHAPFDLESNRLGVELRGEVALSCVERWWPHTHGHQPRYRVAAKLTDRTLELGAVGFRSIEIDRSDGGFTIVVNDVPIFCRGACWVPADPVSLNPKPGEVRASLELLREANCNMVRVPGTMVYESDEFYEACDDLGILVWQDCMLANLEPPDDDGFVSTLEAELTSVCSRLAGRPSIAVISGGSEIEQQAAMSGAGREHWSPRVLTEVVPSVVADELPGVGYVSSTPTGGDLPFSVGVGVAHYFGVGAYLRPLGDARRAQLRFAAECLAFACFPDSVTLDETFGGPDVIGHDPRWKKGVPRDGGVSWDFEDVTSHYVGALFSLDPLQVRYSDPERYADLARAAVVECFSQAFSEWRRTGSKCGGALVLSWRDLEQGAGWGLLDSLGRPKPPWSALRRACAPLAVLLSDEGLDGLHVHLVNDRADDVVGTLRFELFGTGGTRLEQADRSVKVPGRSRLFIEASSMFPGFRDFTYAYRFGPPVYDVVVATLFDDDGETLGEAVYLPQGPARPVEEDLGLKATLREIDAVRFVVDVSSERFAQFVAFDVPGYVPLDSWFHLAPGGIRRVVLVSDPARRGEASLPTGKIRALNSRRTAPVVRERPDDEEIASSSL